MKKALSVIILSLAVSYAYSQNIKVDSIQVKELLAQAKTLFMTDRALSLDKAQQGLTIARKINDRKNEADCLNLIGILYSYSGKYELSLKALNAEIEIAEETHNSLALAKAHNNIGLNYMMQGIYLKSIDESLKALALYNTIGDKSGAGNIYANVANDYYNMNMFDKALTYCDSAIKHFNQTNNIKGVANIYNTYGVIYAEKQQNKKALSYYSRSLKIKEDIGDINGQANALLNMGDVYIALKEIPEAKAALEKAMMLFKKIDDKKGVMAVLSKTAELQSAQKDSLAALNTAQQTYLYAKNNTTKEQQRDAAYNLAVSLQKHGDFKNAIKYFKIYDKLKDTLLNESITRQIADVEAHYENKKKQQQIVLLHDENTIQKMAITRRNITILVVAIIFLLCILAVYQGYNKYNLKQETKLQAEVIRQQDIAAKSIIEAEEKERNRISGDLHDGVGQLFTTVRLNLGTLMERMKFNNEKDHQLALKTLAMVDESCNEVRTIAHQMTPNVLLRMGLGSAIKDFVNKIDSDKLKISLETTGLNERMDNDVETVLYRVIQEAVNNVIKHAKASALDIQLVNEDKTVTVTIEDNGKGFEIAGIEKFEGIGLKNIQTRINYLKGSFEISSEPGKGTLIMIHVPIT